MKRNTVLMAVVAIAILMAHTTVSAHSLSPSEAIARMQNTRKARMAAGKLDLTLRHTAKKGTLSTVYVFSNSRGGTYLLSADDCAPALLGWTEGEYNDTLPEPVQWWISQYSEGIAEAIETGRTITLSESGQPAVEPLLQTTWRQEEPFNDLCNDVANGCLTGCVATAMAQIMKYHNYPAKGTGQNTYTSGTTSITSNFAEHTYQWDKMLNSYNYITAIL